VYNLLEKNGLIIVEVPDERYQSILAVLGKRFGLNYHVHWYSKCSLYYLMKSCGFSNVKVYRNAAAPYSGEKISSLIGIGIKNDNKINQKEVKIPRIRVIVEIFEIHYIFLVKIIDKLLNISFFKRLKRRR